MLKPYYQDNAVTIYHGDCREIVPQLGRFDLLLTDPPYGIGADTHEGPAEHGWKQWRSSGWDREKPDSATIAAMIAAATKAIVWGGNYFDLPPRMGWLVWDKGQRGFSLADGELAWTSENRALRIFNYARGKATAEGREHPTQKPLPLMTWCIGLAGDVQTILDPFAGSGTTGRAAKDLGKQATLIEREERYCEIAARRMRQEVLPLEYRDNAPRQPRRDGGVGLDAVVGLLPVGLIPIPPMIIQEANRRAMDNGDLTFGHGFALGLALCAAWCLCAAAIWIKRAIVRRFRIGRPISRRQALLLARQILHQAEQNRAIFAVSEAQRGIHWEEEQ